MRRVVSRFLNSLNKNKSHRVVCGISGGVDSAVAALLLKRRGFDVTGVYMKNWDQNEERDSCTNGEKDLEDARSACRQIGIEFLEVSFVKEYWNDVFNSLLLDYERGLTPNPDVNCNRFIKFGAFYRYAVDKLKAEAIATGHYARTSFGPYLELYQPKTKVKLLRALDSSKDQTLFLSQVSQEPLGRTMFPLGNLFKSQVRELAREAKLHSVYKKKDSTGICFIGKRRFTDFISEYIREKTGPFVDIETKEVVGWHKGVHHWTIGQNCRIGGKKKPYYVSFRDATTQTIFVCPGRQHHSLLSNRIETLPPHWIASPPPEFPYICMFKFQHTEWTVPCIVLEGQNGGLQVHLALPTRAITPGQFAVFYTGDICLGSSQIISRKLNWNYEADVLLSPRKTYSYQLSID